MGAFGYAVQRLEYDVSGVSCRNLIAEHNGSTCPSEIVLLGARYDSVLGSPGANDNASGIAALLEISRMFQNIQPELTVRFVAFVNEEPPLFMTDQQGSAVYSRDVRRRGDDVRLMISLEMIGYYSDARESELPAFVPILLPDRRHGYRALMVTDTAFYRYGHCHAASDTPDKLAYPEFAQVTLGLFEAVAVLSREGVD